MDSAVVNDGVADFHIFIMLVILLHFVWWKVAQPVLLVLHGLYISSEMNCEIWYSKEYESYALFIVWFEMCKVWDTVCIQANERQKSKMTFDMSMNDAIIYHVLDEW